MKAVKFQGDEYIYTKGSLIDEIFFLVKGKVGLVIPEFDDISYVNIHPNDYFGDIDYVCKDNDGKRQFTVKALDNCEVYQLSKVDLHELELEFKDVVDDFFEVALKRLKVAKKMKNRAEEFIIKKNAVRNTNFLTTVCLIIQYN